MSEALVAQWAEHQLSYTDDRGSNPRWGSKIIMMPENSDKLSEHEWERHVQMVTAIYDALVATWPFVPSLQDYIEQSPESKYRLGTWLPTVPHPLIDQDRKAF